MVSSQTSKPAAKIVEFFYILSLLALSFDFKDLDQQGSKVQVLFYVAFLILSATTILYALSIQDRIRIPFILIAFGILFVLVGILTGLFNQQRTYDVFSLSTPTSIYVITAVSTSITFSIGNTERLLRKLKIICIIYLSVHFILEVFMRGGLDLSVSRYEFLSGAYIAALGVFALGFGVRFRILESVISFAVLFLVVISITRTVIPIFLVQMFFVYFSIPKVISISKLRVAVLLILMPIGLFAIDVGAGLGLTDRWVGRLTVSQRAGADPSGLSRLAETRYMIEQFASSTETILFGNGIAAQTALSGPEARQLSQIFGSWSATGHGKGFGHNNHLSLLFVSGIVGGAPLLLLQFGHGVQSALVGLRLRRRKTLDDKSLQYAAIWGGLIISATLIYGFLAPTFVHRDVCLWYGVGTGLVSWAKSKLTTGAPDVTGSETRDQIVSRKIGAA